MFRFTIGETPENIGPEKPFEFVDDYSVACYTCRVSIGYSDGMSTFLLAKLSFGINVQDIKTNRVIPIIRKGRMIFKDGMIHEIKDYWSTKWVLLFLETTSYNVNSLYQLKGEPTRIDVYYKVMCGRVKELWGKYPKFILKVYPDTRIELKDKTLESYCDDLGRVQLRFL